MASSGRDTEHGAEADHRWRALGVCLVAVFMTGLDVSIVNVAVPSIQEGLNSSEDGIQWILSGYALMFGLVLVPSGRLGDELGRRRLFLLGVIAFTVTSLGCGASPDAHWLVVSRFLQGAAAGCLNPQVSGLIQQMFSGVERGRAFGALGATMGVATASGPALGGLLITLAGEQQGWRAVFVVNVPIGIALLFLARRLLPATPSARQRQDLDPLGVLLLGAGVVALLLPFVEYRQWPGNAKWLLLPLAVALLITFVWWERRHRRRGGTPLVDLGLFGFRSYRLGAALGTAYFAGFTGIFFTFTLYLQNGLHYTPLQAGLAITPFAIGSALGALSGGRRVVHHGRIVVVVGLIVAIVGLAATLLVDLMAVERVGLLLALPLFVAGFGSGHVIAPNQTLALSQVPPAGGGSAAGVVQTGQRIGTSIGIAATGLMFFSALDQGWASAFQHGLTVILAFVTVALLIGIADLVLTRREKRSLR